MKPKNDLFLLIKSLTKNEKRYFRMFASMQGENKVYVKLFDAILKQDEYSEAGLKEIFRGERFIKQLSFAKSYLYKLIMKSLILCNSESIADSKVYDMIMRAKILFKKALIPQYFKTLQQAKEIALKYERFGYLMEIYDMMRLIVKKEKFLKNEDKEIYPDAEDAIAKLENIFEYSRLLNGTFGILRSWGKSTNKTAEKEINKILKSHLMENESKALSLRAKEIYFSIHETAALIRSDNTSERKYLQKRYKLIDSNPYPFEGHILNYRKDVLQNLLYNMAENNNYEKIGEYLEIYKNAFHGTHNIEEVNDFSFYSSIALDTHIKNKNYSAGTAFINEIEAGIKKHKNKMDIATELSLKFKIINLLVLARKYEKALEKLNDLLKHPLLPIRTDIECYCRLLNLLIHFELGNTGLLEYLLKSTYRYLYKKDRLYKLETLILSFIRKTPRMENSDSLFFHLHILKREMQKLKNDPYEKNAFKLFDFLEWVNMKLASK